VREMLAGAVVTCGAGDDVHDALAVMRRHQVRRLPVVDEDRRLVGLFSLTDAVMSAGSGDEAPTADEVLETLRAVSKPHLRAPRPVGSEGEVF